MHDPDATIVRAPRPRPDAQDPDRTVVTGPRTVPAAAPVALPAGYRLHEYRIERVLGQGGFGITYLATDVHLRAPVAVKEYLPAEIAFRGADASVWPSGSRHRDRYRQGLESFLVEARTLAGFRHPSIVRVARFFEANRTAYMVLEYEAGASLKAWWPGHRDLGEARLVDLLHPLLDGLAVLHAAGVLHRDIKPDNIQVRSDDGRLVLLDFGAAGQAAAVAAPAAAVLTPGYAPPEQYGVATGAREGPWTDLYALGATLYWLVAGRKPPDAETRRDDPRAHVRAVEAGRGRYGESFLRAIDWALALHPKDRPHDVLVFRHALFADHQGAFGLKEALKSGDTLIEGDRPPPRPGWRQRAVQALAAARDPGAWPLALKTTVAMLSAALLPMLLVAAYNDRASVRALEGAELRFVEQLAHSTAGRLAQFVADSRHYARAVAADPDVVLYAATPDAAGRAVVADKLARQLAAHPDVQRIALVDAAGRVLAAAGSDDGVQVAETVKGDDGMALGRVALDLKPQALAAILDEVRHDSRLEPLLLDRGGTVLNGPNAGRALAEAPLREAMRGAAAPGTLAWAGRLGGAAGVPQIAGYAPVAGAPWVVGVRESRAVFEAPLKALNQRVLASVVLVGLLAAGLALRFGRGIVQPIRALTQAAHALKAGDFHHATVPVERRDEIGQLARTFNVMIDVLRQRERERERGR